MKFKPLGNLIMLELSLGGEETTEHGIIYEKTIQSYVWGKVVAIGPGIPAPQTGKIPELDLKIGDEVMVLFRSFKGTYQDGLYTDKEIAYHLYDRSDIICVKEK
jgi:co-chaperonin GroES (HSP10)